MIYDLFIYLVFVKPAMRRAYKKARKAKNFEAHLNSICIHCSDVGWHRAAHGHPLHFIKCVACK